MNRMIYVRKSDESFWVRAEADAAKRGMALSVLLSELVRAYVYDLGFQKSAAKTPAELITEAEDAIRRARDALSVQEG